MPTTIHPMKYLALVVRYELVIQREDAPSMKAGLTAAIVGIVLCTSSVVAQNTNSRAATPRGELQKSNVKLESGTSMLLRVKQ